MRCFGIPPWVLAFAILISSGRGENADPGPPENINVEGVSGSSLNITWDSPDLAPMYYIVEYFGSSSGNEIAYENYCLIEGLEACSYYDVQVTSVYTSGNVPGKITTGQTGVGVPEAPRDLKCKMNGTALVAVNWQHPSTLCVIINYRLSWAWEGLGSGVDGGEGGPIYVKTTQKVLRGAPANSNVTVEVSASAGDTYGPSTSCYVITPAVRVDEDPGPPENIHVESVSASSLNVTWDSPDLAPMYYIVEYFGSSSGNEIAYENYYLIEGLEACSYYDVQVTSVYASGNVAGKITTGQTGAGVPEAPRDLKCAMNGTALVTVSWQPPSTLCAIINYRFSWAWEGLDSGVDGGEGGPIYVKTTQKVLRGVPANSNVTVEVSASAGDTFGPSTSCYVVTPEVKVDEDPETVIVSKSGYMSAKILQPPTIDQVEPLSDSSINVSWTGITTKSYFLEDQEIVVLKKERMDPVDSGRMDPVDSGTTTPVTRSTATEDVLTYIVEWIGVSTNKGGVSDPVTQFTYVVQGLDSCTRYNISVTALLGSNSSEPSSGVAITLPPPPRDVAVIVVGANLNVTWNWEATGDADVNKVNFFVDYVIYSDMPCWGGNGNVTHDNTSSHRYVITDINSCGLPSNFSFEVCVLAEVQPCGNSIKICQDALVSPKESNLGLTVGLPIGLLLLLAIAAGLVYYLKCYDKNRKTSNINVQYDHRRDSINIQSNQREILYDQFEQDVKNLKFSSSTTEGAEHRMKNRFKDILPYNSTLVKLKRVSYINASYVLDKKFIATQDPLIDQGDDFWQMIWECNVGIILRLSAESTEHPTAPYIKDNTHGNWVMGHDEITVTVRDIYHIGNYCKKIIVAEKDSDERTIEHYHMTKWADGGVPQRDDILDLVTAARSARRRMYEGQTKIPPVLIHCRGGVGRTGTVIAIWHMIDDFDNNRNENIYRTVEKMRKDRMCMVQTKEQYAFVYECVEEYKLDRPRWQSRTNEYETMG